MKKFATCFFALLLATPAIAADGDVTISRTIPGTKSNTTTNDVSGRGVTTRNQSDNSTSVTPSRTATASRVVATTTNSSQTQSSGRTNTTRTQTPSRATAATTAQNTNSRGNLDTAVHTVGRNARTANTGINSTAAVRRAGITLRPSTAEVGGRAKIAGTDIQTGSNVGGRGVAARAATVTRETIAEAKERLETTAELNDTCQMQYNDCMDQFCAVIDANQKRCSCSANLSRYTKVESAVKEANTQLNDVAQRIRYVGLSADEIRAIMSATEAEEALSGAKDTTETRSLLDDIEELIKNPSSTNTYASDNMSLLDLNLDFSADSSDLFNLDFLNNNSSNFSNLRGTDLYNAAKKRCNTVLTQCKGAGANNEQIAANYDLAIDKDCIAYEQGLNKMNETLVSNVRSANLMLQKARLAVLQNKNQYDAKGCIAALDTCMTDDMVCGENYNKCLDPTKRFIDENGNVVLGEDITNITDFMSGFNSSQIDSISLNDASNTTISVENCKSAHNGQCVIKYLLNKIGTGKTVAENGLCRAVLDKCQRYTYSTSGAYNPYNDIVVNYIQRAMVNIRAAQQQIISDYAANCMVDIATCYNQQVTQVNAWSSNASVSSIRNVMQGACRNVALTCAYAVFAEDTQSCPADAASNATSAATCINSVSEMFYQSMLCPDNSIYNAVGQTRIDPNDTEQGFVNAHCKCKPGYVVWGSTCITQCEGGIKHDSYGACKTPTAECPVNSSPATRNGTVAENFTAGGYVTTSCKCNSGYVTFNGRCTIACAEGYNEDGSCQKTPTPDLPSHGDGGDESGDDGNESGDGGDNGDDKPVTILCPENSSQDALCQSEGVGTGLQSCVTTSCRCNAFYRPLNGKCTLMELNIQQ